MYSAAAAHMLSMSSTVARSPARAWAKAMENTAEPPPTSSTDLSSANSGRRATAAAAEMLCAFMNAAMPSARSRLSSPRSHSSTAEPWRAVACAFLSVSIICPCSGCAALNTCSKGPQ
ncbi:hypothetical protein D3C83_40290 [compost metagenome]